MHRSVQPEILDSLAPDDPAAIANRRDLRTFNHLMGNFRWVRKELSGYSAQGAILELGAGDGSLGLYLLRKGVLSDENLYTGMDIIRRPRGWPPSWGWMQKDLRELAFPEDTRTVIANMILHQFESEELSNLGLRIERSGLKRLLLCEPARRRVHLRQVAASRFLLGVHPVTLHDARVSIEAGFRGEELAEALNLDRRVWSIRCTEHFLGANRLLCLRR
ncbi:MAG: class I SAM-dependent methyltransferase [Puniceicoccaceae bacterium]